MQVCSLLSEFGGSGSAEPPPPQNFWSISLGAEDLPGFGIFGSGSRDFAFGV